MNSINIEIPSLLDNIRIVESFVDNTKEKYELTDDLYGNIMVAVIESVNNAIVHGNQSDRSKNVQLSAEFEDDYIRFLVRDEGNGFNHNTLPDPTSPDNLEKSGGRGIFLMKHLSDEVSFKDEGRLVILTFYLT